ncbi:MAG: flagellar filament capping protein FliD [Spirochaetes bacterium]|nr:flagellar filament capping protein FliD [Spirochaetota bacterium]
MPVTMSGMASGMDTDSIIDKLVDVEARPIKQLEIRKKSHNLKKDGLKVLGRYLGDINSAAKELYGFRASFNDKSASSSDSSALEAKATSLADKGLRRIKIIQIATPHKVSTDPIQEEEIIPAGKFTIEVDGEKETINFKGGKLKRLAEQIQDTASDLVATTYIRKSGDEYLMTIQSNKTGEKGEIKLTGDKGLLDKIGLTGGVRKESVDEVKVSFDSRYFTSYMGDRRAEAENGSVRVGENGVSVTVKGLIWREYALPIEMAIKEDSQFEFELSYRDKTDGEDEGIPRRLQVGPEEKINIKGIILEGYNVERTREGKKDARKVYDSLMGVGLVSSEEGRRVERLYPIGGDAAGLMKIPVGKDFSAGTISKIIIYCNRGAMEVSRFRITTPAAKKDWPPLKNVIALPRDAKISVDGIEITRDRNDNLNDIIKGVTLSLKRPTQGEIDLSVENDTEASIEKIKKFVDAYNKYLDYQREATKAAIAKKPGEYKDGLSEKGLFVGDTTLMRLESALRMTVTDAYPGGGEKPIKMLSQIGVTTGAINAEWESIKAGKLVIDEAELKKAIIENPDGVSSFFGTDTDGDNRTDNGMAFKVIYVLKPYVSPGKNILSAKIELEDNSIKLADESIRQKEDHLKKYEDKLRRKFSQMEQAITQTNSQRQWMRQQFEGISGLERDGKDK